MSTKILLFTFNRPDILEKQVNSIKKHLKNNHEIIVVHDSRDYEYFDKFSQITQRLNIKLYHRNSEFGKSPSQYHADAIQWAYDSVVKDYCKDDIVVFLDHDMFLIDDLDIIKFMENYDIVGCLQNRNQIKYVWPGLFIFKEKSLRDIEFDFDPQVVNGLALDTGGGTYKLLQDKKLKFRDSGVVYPDEYKGLSLKDPNVTNGYDYELHLDEKFLHFRNASNWHTNFNVSDENKTLVLDKIMKDILEDKDKSFFEIVVARYSENLDWTKSYSDFVTIYNKGNATEYESVSLPNIGREAHTYLHHIVNNYNNLAEYNCFLQGNPYDPHTPSLDQYLDYVINSNELVPDFVWLSSRMVESDFEYEREPYHAIFPNIKFAYKTIFGKDPEDISFVFGSGAQFMVSKSNILKRPLEFYENLLDIFNYSEGTEIGQKLLGNPGSNNLYCPCNPEISLHLERFWGFIFNTDV